MLVGAEVQGSTPEAILEVVDDQKMKFAVTKGMSGPSLGNSIPRMAVFGVDGKLIYSGYPNDDATDVIRRELRKVGESEEDDAGGVAMPSRLVETREWTNADGGTVEAALLSLEGTTGTFIRTNGSTFVYDITKLSAEDQELIEKAAWDGEEESL